MTTLRTSTATCLQALNLPFAVAAMMGVPASGSKREMCILASFGTLSDGQSTYWVLAPVFNLHIPVYIVCIRMYLCVLNVFAYTRVYHMYFACICVYCMYLNVPVYIV